MRLKPIEKAKTLIINWLSKTLYGILLRISWEDFELVGYEPYPNIKAEMSV